MKKAIIYFFILLMTSCSLNKRPDAGNYPSGLVFPLEIADRHTFTGMNIGHISGRDGCLYITTGQGWFYCLNQQRGEEVWTCQINVSWSSPPFLGDTGIYAVSSNNHIFKLSYDGKVIWDIEIEIPVTSGIAEDSGLIYYGDENGSLKAGEAETGEELWSFETGSAIRSTPRVFQGRIFFGAGNGVLYILNRNGKETARFETGGEIREAVAVEGHRVFFGSADQYIYCADWTRGKVRWKMKTGGEISAPISLGEKYIYLTSGNNVLYCFYKKNGTMKWWRKIPAYTYFAPLLTPEKVVVSSSSPKLLGFNQTGGEAAGEYTAAEEIRSNPVWSDPHLIVAVFHDFQDESELLFLKKAVYVNVETSPDSPQPANQNIEVTAQGVGFYQPEFEFSLQRFVPLSFGWWPVLFMPADKAPQVMQPFSEENSWDWFPEKSGAYMISVKAKDEKESGENDVYYLIRSSKEKTKKGKEL